MSQIAELDVEHLKFLLELEELINKYSKENDSDSPDFILASYLSKCLENFNLHVKARDGFYGYEPWKMKRELSA